MLKHYIFFLLDMHNTVTAHLCQACPEIPKEVKDELSKVQKDKSSAGGGKKYWAEGAINLGVYEMPEGGLRFKPADP